MTLDRLAKLEAEVKATQDTLTRIHARAASAEKSRNLRLTNLERSTAGAKIKQRAKAQR
ncbi:MAG: hypothetical protein ACN6OP_27580 [Pseudomonadales bacterium]